ncbi:hypothetical protein G6F56_000461 [Rhizopus delemar]|uniref:Uncharacterized protein n=1 Tax=Rhizopus stolonifer TaxID=4846 RepID=A0A367KTM8_RHIST|nr:hypothetical protein G6F56_000461 [Rhizopus delemar]RCI05536.1 hypothetical protein CU098_013505 [Rhizopus stolonifer]
MQEVLKAKQELFGANADIYRARHGAVTSILRRQKKIHIDLSKPCHHKFVFSGTDNGIVNVKETVFFGVDKLKYRLRLHDHFQVLQNQDDTYMEEAEDAQLHQLPKFFTFRIAALRQQSGLASY